MEKRRIIVCDNTGIKQTIRKETTQILYIGSNWYSFICSPRCCRSLISFNTAVVDSYSFILGHRSYQWHVQKISCITRGHKRTLPQETNQLLTHLLLERKLPSTLIQVTYRHSECEYRAPFASSSLPTYAHGSLVCSK